MDDLIKLMDPTEENGRFGKMIKVLRAKYTAAGKPLKGTLELTSRCSLDCKMCYVHCNGLDSYTLSGDEWIRIIDEAVDSGMLICVLTGGECFLHPDFRRIYEYLKQRGVFVQILSNGTLIDEETVDWLREMPPQLIRITVYGSCPEVYERVTGSADAFYKVDRALTLLHEAGITTDISLTISRYNKDDVESLLDYVKAKKHALTILSCEMFQPDEATGRHLEDIALTAAEQEEIYETLFRRDGYEYRPTCEEDFVLSRPKNESDVEAQKQMPCVAGRCAFYISATGVMDPCISYPLVRASVLGLGFQRAWTSVRDAVKGYTRSEECLACDYLGLCRFCAARYATASGGKNGLCGSLPCNKYTHVLPEVIRRKYLGGNNHEKNV